MDDKCYTLMWDHIHQEIMIWWVLGSASKEGRRLGCSAVTTVAAQPATNSRNHQ